MPANDSAQSKSGLDARTSTSITLAVVSPCSSCPNRRSVTDKDGKSPCPRMAAIARKKDAAQKGEDFSLYEHTALTGLEYNPFTKPQEGVLANPVYDPARRSVYIWVARLIDNSGAGDIPPISDSAFFPTYAGSIQCMPLPVLPDDTLAGYFLRGRMKEGDTVLVTSFRGQQVDKNRYSIMIDGVAHKISLHGAFPVEPRPTKDDHPRGS